MNRIFSIHISFKGQLDYFELLVIINKAAKIMVESVSFLYFRAIFGCMSRSAIAGSSVRTISSFLRNCQLDLQRGFTSLQSY